MSNISETVKEWPVVDGWSISPGVEWCEKGFKVWIESDVWIGSGVWIGSNVRIGSTVRIGSEVRIGSNVRIGSKVRIGSNVRIGSKVRIENDVWVSSDVWIGSKVRIGSNVRIGSSVRIENDVWIESGHKLRKGAIPVCTVGFADGYQKSLSDLNGVAYIGAGCRWFTLDEAIKHWQNHDEDRSLTLCLMESAKAIARTLGLKTS